MSNMTQEHATRLGRALQDRKGTVITYVSGNDSVSHDFLFYPKRMFERNGYIYVKGWSAHQPRRIMLWRAPFRYSGKVRVFRVDRVLAVTDRRAEDWSLTSYVKRKIRQRGLIPGLWGLFLDLLLFAFLVGCAFHFIHNTLGN